jgi:hypothetical protein
MMDVIGPLHSMGWDPMKWYSAIAYPLYKIGSPWQENGSEGPETSHDQNRTGDQKHESPGTDIDLLSVRLGLLIIVRNVIALAVFLISVDSHIHHIRSDWSHPSNLYIKSEKQYIKVILMYPIS